MYTTPQVLEEIEKAKNVYLRVRGLIDSNRLRLLYPEEKSLSKIRNSCQAIEGFGILSDADLSVVALAMEMADLEPSKKTVIVTDDYAIQNVAANMQVEYRAVMTRGIRDKGSWAVYCPGCGRKQEGVARVCGACGTKYRRRLITR